MKYALSTISFPLLPFLFSACGAEAPTSPTPQSCTTEVCDLRDNDCDGAIDEGNGQDASPAPAPWYHDADRDGWGESAVPCDAETAGTEWSHRAGDCNEADPNIHPDAYEYCNDGIDRNCDDRPTRCGIYGEMALSDAGATIVGEVAGHRFGNKARLAADFDQDGFFDLMVSSNWKTNHYVGSDIPITVEGEGEFWLQYGPLFGLRRASELDEHIAGPNIEAELGDEIGAGDINGDGIADLILGSPGGQAEASKDYQGIVYLFFGPLEAGLSLLDADGYITGEQEGDYFGNCIAEAGDTNGDHIPDLLVSTAFTDAGDAYSVGSGYLFNSPVEALQLSAGSADTIITGTSVNASFAATCVLGGDLNGDGRAELGLAQYRDSSHACQAGSFYIFSTPPAGNLSPSNADIVLYSDAIGEWFGGSAAITGDINGDGLDDVMIGAPSETSQCGAYEPTSDERGHAYLFFSPLSEQIHTSQAAAVFEGEEAGDHAGGSVLTDADFDQDGFSDIVITASSHLVENERLGAVYLYYGPVIGFHSLSDADARIVGVKVSSYPVAKDVGGDLNGDGYPDLVLTTTGPGADGKDPGTVYIFFGGPRP